MSALHAPPLPRLSQRRRLVGFTYSCAVLGLLLLLAHWTVSSGPMGTVGALLSLATLIGVAKLRKDFPQATPAEGHWDERQRERITWAYASAFQVVCTLVCVAVTGAVLYDFMGWTLRLPPGMQWLSLLYVYCVALFGLPAAFLAWTEPDLTDE